MFLEEPDTRDNEIIHLENKFMEYREKGFFIDLKIANPMLEPKNIHQLVLSGVSESFSELKNIYNVSENIILCTFIEDPDVFDEIYNLIYRKELLKIPEKVRMHSEFELGLRFLRVHGIKGLPDYKFNRNEKNT